MCKTLNPVPQMIRLFPALFAALALTMPVQAQSQYRPYLDAMFGAPGSVAPGGVGQMPAHQVQQVTNPAYLRQVVHYSTSEAPGTIVIDTTQHFLYLVLDGDKAMRYGIGVARFGFEWNGTHEVTRKAEWPSWTPPAEMHARQPGLPRFMEGGPNNPMGARALYLGSTLYRIHGTNEPWTIGQSVSSGCIRLLNDDVIDLYERVPVGAKVIVV